MGVTVANILEVRDTQDGVTAGWWIRLHLDAAGVDTEPRVALGPGQFAALVQSCRASATAADVALLAAWPAWWGGLDPATRATWAAHVREYAVGATWWP